MRKIMIGVVLIIIIFVSTLIVANNSYGPKNAKSDEQIENELVKSMEETKNEKEKLEKLLTRSSKELMAKGYGEVGIGFSHEDRILTAQVKDKDFLEANKGQIENIISTIAKEAGFGDFEVKFRVLDMKVTHNEEDQKLMESINKASKVVSDLLTAKGYNFNYSISVNPKKEIIIEGTDKNLVRNDDFQKLISNAISSETNMDFEVTLKKKSESERRDQEWQPVFTAIIEETNKKFKEYRGFAYSFHPQPLQIIIKTKITNRLFENPDEKVEEIENYVDKIIELKIEALSN